MLFSGHTGTVPGDTWGWSGRLWERCDVGVNPAGRSGHAMAFDPISRRLVLFGGYSVGFLGDTWTLTPVD